MEYNMVFMCTLSSYFLSPRNFQTERVLLGFFSIYNVHFCVPFSGDNTKVTSCAASFYANGVPDVYCYWMLTLRSWSRITRWVVYNMHFYSYTPAPRRGRGVYCFISVRLSFRPSKIFFVTFFSVTVDARNLIFGHKRHIGIPYCG